MFCKGLAFAVAVLLIQVIHESSSYKIKLPKWLKEKERPSTGGWGGADEKRDEAFDKCCKELGVPEALRVVACKYRNFESLVARGEDVAEEEEQLARCNLVQHWPYTPQVMYCLHDSIPIGDCVSALPNENGEWFPEDCDEAFGQGRPVAFSNLRDNAQKFLSCFDFTRETVTCARDAIIDERETDNTHYVYKTAANAPKLNGNEDLDVCKIKTDGEDITARRKLYLKTCQISEKSAYDRWREEQESGRFQNAKVYDYDSFYHPEDCYDGSGASGSEEGSDEDS